ncbi:Uma2 family endonuclease [Butyrivibrio sp. VCB2006]|uniref:Uma2 family endonuclease n=1 Tax=Butyrivibrio sp. VCB2006 TaxID=1280679 RepID=UPI000403B1FB|nr:Uma2 family endonuclease [Butyrivibrio sp. VCB2006]
MTIEEMIEIKKHGGYSYKLLANLSGLEAAVIQKIFTGKTKSPRHDTIVALEKAFETLRESKEIALTQRNSSFGENGLCEPEIEYGSKGKSDKYTVSDYWALPEGNRKELIDGKFYDMSAPGLDHQIVAREISNTLINSISSRKGKCQVFFSPLGVQLNKDDKTMVEPDIIIVCDKDKYYGKKNIMGAPDFIVEIISDSTKKKDMTVKLAKYEDAGVREYWIVDPKKRIVISYVFAEEVTPTIYTFDDVVPIAIYDGKIKVNFKEIKSTLEMMGV